MTLKNAANDSSKKQSRAERYVDSASIIRLNSDEESAHY